MKYGFEIAILIEILLAVWLVGAVMANVLDSRGYTVSGTVTVTSRWQGDNAPYENLTIRTTDGRVFSQVVSCDLYQNATKVTVTGYDSIWLFPLVQSNIINESPHFSPANGCTHS